MSSMNAPLLSICIVTYKSRDHLDALLKPLYAAPAQFEFEVLVVDNASGDGIREMLRAKYPAVDFIQNSANRFYTAALNQNLKRSRGRYVLVINPDTELAGDAIPAMVSYMESHPETGAICPKFLKPDGSLRNAIGTHLTFKWGLYETAGINGWKPGNSEHRRVMPSGLWYDPDKVRDAEVLYGACILMRREALEKTGWMDEALVHGWDEYDWCRRARDAGWRLQYFPGATVMHIEGASRKESDVHSKLEQFHYDGMFHLYRKQYGALAAGFLHFVASYVRPLVARCVRFFPGKN